jgi:hypothetical protein
MTGGQIAEIFYLNPHFSIFYLNPLNFYPQRIRRPKSISENKIQGAKTLLLLFL